MERANRHGSARSTRQSPGGVVHLDGTWEFDQLSGSGHVELDKGGRLRGKLRIERGDDSDFVAERTEEPEEPIPDPPSYSDKWRRRW